MKIVNKFSKPLILTVETYFAIKFLIQRIWQFEYFCTNDCLIDCLDKYNGWNNDCRYLNIEIAGDI